MTILHTVREVLDAELAAKRSHDLPVANSARGTASTQVDSRIALPRESILVALSGGADSTALLLCVAAYCGRGRANIIACHFDHGLRSRAEHAADLDSVRAACADIDVPLIADGSKPGAVRTIASEQHSGIEAASRSLRYQFFSRVARAVGARWICTGHTEDDQVETVLISLGRCVDPLALTGIPERRVLAGGVVLLRPLLSVRRERVEEYLRERGISWREDPSNEERGHERNRVRHELLPELEHRFPAFRDTILALRRTALARRAVATEGTKSLTWLSCGDDSTLDANLFYRDSRDARLLSLFEEASRREMIKPSSRLSVRFFAPLLGLLPAQGTIVRSRRCHIRLTGNLLVWSADIVPAPESGYLRSVALGVAVELPGGHILMLHSGEIRTTDNMPSVIELERVHEPLVVRSPRVGDAIRTERGRTSVATLLSERGVRQRYMIPIVCDRDGVVAVLTKKLGFGPDVVALRPGSSGPRQTLEISGVQRDG